jgi:hypothetical protein
MNENVLKIYEHTLSIWRRSPRGLVVYDNDELSIYFLSLLLASKVYNNNKKASILIVIPNDDAYSVLSGINLIYPEFKFDELMFNIKIKTIHQVFKEPYVDLLITINPDAYIINNKIALPDWLMKLDCKFYLGASNSYNITNYYKDVPLLENITTKNVVIPSANGTKQFNLNYALSDKDKDKLDQYSTFINDTISMFDGNIEFIYNCIADKTNVLIENMAFAKGWHRDLDFTVHYNQEINRYFSPTSIYERCVSFNNTVKDRQKLIQDNKVKLEIVKTIVSNNIDKRICIISKNSTMALTYTDYINKTFNNISKISMFDDAIDSSICKGICVNINSNIETIFPKDNDGNNILTNTGQPKKLGATFQNRYSIKQFMSNRCKVASINNTPPNYTEIKADIMIFTSPECNTLAQLKSRCEKFILNENGIIVYLYCDYYKKDVNSLENVNSLSKNQIILASSVADIKF